MINLDEKNQPIACKLIKNIVNKNHYSHAYIIETNGYEKSFDFVLNFAKLLLCPNYNKSCNECNFCQMIDTLNFPELKIINPDGAWIKKEQVLELQKEFSEKPIIGNKKVYIINGANKLNASSSNTILKFLEEPAEGIIALLVTDSIYQLLDTIRSRCQIISLNGQVKDISLIEKLGTTHNNKMNYEDFIDDSNDIKKIDLVINFINYLEKNGLKVITHIYEYFFQYFNDKETVLWALEVMIYFYRDVLNFKINSNISLFNTYEEYIKNISSFNKIEDLVKKINIINENKKNIDLNANLNLLLDKMIIEMKEV